MVWGHGGTLVTRGDKLVLRSDRDGNFELYVANLDQASQQQGSLSRITTNPSFDAAANWSVELDEIAFESTRDGNYELYVIRPDGSGLRRLTDNEAADKNPSWSPDGARIAFQSTRGGGGHTDIYVMDSDGSNVRRLTSSPAPDEHPEWSPDGTQLAFESNRDGAWNIYVMSSTQGEDGGVEQLTNTPVTDVRVAWCEDRIAFHSDREGSMNVYVMNLRTEEIVRVTNHVDDETRPAWRPDCERIAYTRHLRHGWFRDLIDRPPPQLD